MDAICGVGLPELVIVALLAFIVVGPERSREVALQVGRFLRGVMRSGWWRDINEIGGALRNLPTTLVRMAELEEAQADLQRTMQEIDNATRMPPSPGGEQPSHPGASPAPNAGLTDPWGIRNATAQTRFSRPPVSKAEGSESDPHVAE